MDFLRNPFHLLAATPRDNRQRLMELADERSLVLDSGECMEARSCLTNPRKRLSAEISWLPGLAPKRVGEVLSLLESSPSDLLAARNISSIARTNLLAAGLARLSAPGVDDVVEWILELAKAFEAVIPEEVRALVNAERVASGFPEVTDGSSVEAEILDRRRYYCNVMKTALDGLPALELVRAVTVAVDSATDEGEELGPVLIADLVDAYEVEAQTFLAGEEENIKILVEKLRGAVDAKHPDSTLTLLVNRLVQVVKNWDSVAQPIQVSAKSRGLEHAASLRIAKQVRGLAIHMFNEHDKLEFSRQITRMLQEVFAEVGGIAERSAEDADTLSEIAEQRAHHAEHAKTRAEEWRREISYQADIGLIFTKKLCISPEGIDWKGRRWPLDAISRIRWGGVRHVVNGIPSGTTYHIMFGTPADSTSIELRKQTVYSNFIDRLWKGIGVRLLADFLEGLQDGRTYRFGSVVVSDLGMELGRMRFFDNDRVFCRWNELVIWNDAGAFCIGKKDDKELSATLSYLDMDNIHVLETAISAFWKRGGVRLSSLLQD